MDYEKISLCGYQDQAYDRPCYSDVDDHIAVENCADEQTQRAIEIQRKQLDDEGDGQSSGGIEIKNHLVDDEYVDRLCRVIF